MTPKGLRGTPQREQPRRAPLARRSRSVPADPTLSRRPAGFAANQPPSEDGPWALDPKISDFESRRIATEECSFLSHLPQLVKWESSQGFPSSKQPSAQSRRGCFGVADRSTEEDFHAPAPPRSVERFGATTRWFGLIRQCCEGPRHFFTNERGESPHPRGASRDRLVGSDPLVIVTRP